MKILATNKSAGMNYELIQKYEAGLVLFGPEVKSIKENSLVLENSFVHFKKKSAFIFNMFIPKYRFDQNDEIIESRTRQLLLHKKEIQKLQESSKLLKLSVIPTKLYLNRKGLIKIEIALAKPLKKWDKREREKQREFIKEKNKYIL